ncbi:hypothetical protein ABIA33_000895 [Streptacidiphilus sp. MAP12-16]|uniref:hypothetical protein n=1 Tax=Streptacidiphilus sp. MAP12-16 TaxID=3156300 RepID=UPI0035121D54
MTPSDEPRDAPPPDKGTVHLRGPFQDTPPVPDNATVQLGQIQTAPVPMTAPAPAPVPTPTLVMPMPVPLPVPAPAPTLQPAQPSAQQPALPAEGLIRFGPGVPDPKTARTIAVWKGAGPGPAAAPEAKPGRRVGRYALAGVVLLAVVAFLLWQRFGPSLAVSSVSVAAAPASLGCDGTEVVTATLQTNGRSGTVHYRWVRSDGTDSGVLQQSVPAGLHQVSVPLRWTVQGKGTFQGTATVWITGPVAGSASASFSYSCP